MRDFLRSLQGRVGHPGRCFIVLAATAACIAGATAASAQAPLIDEMRLGVFAHNVEASSAESGTDINVELLFRRPAIAYGNRVLDVLLRPRPHIGASINTAGDTSQVYAGFSWDMKLAPALVLELTFGGTWHDGPENGGAPDLYGCPLAFRESISLGLALDQRWTVYGTVTHMSNAGLCDFNSGLTSAGLRLGYKLH